MDAEGNRELRRGQPAVRSTSRNRSLGRVEVCLPAIPFGSLVRDSHPSLQGRVSAASTGTNRSGRFVNSGMVRHVIQSMSTSLLMRAARPRQASL